VAPTPYHLSVRGSDGLETVVSIPAESLDDACQKAEYAGWVVLAQADTPGPGRRPAKAPPVPTANPKAVMEMTRNELTSAIAVGVFRGFLLWTGFSVLIGLVVGILMFIYSNA
jgi:hypothetical protein